jgi:hypothetical protein
MRLDDLVVTPTCTDVDVPSLLNRSGATQTGLGLSQWIAGFPSSFLSDRAG